MLSYVISSFENCMYLKLSYSLQHNIILFSENNYKKQAQMFYQKCFFNSILKKITGLGLEIIIQWTGTRKILELPYRTRTIL